MSMNEIERGEALYDRCARVLKRAFVVLTVLALAYYFAIR